MGFGAVPPHTASSLASASSSVPHGARQDLATAREACTVERQRQRDQRTVVALLPGAPEAGTLAVRVAVIVNVGEIVEGDGVGDVEQRALTVEQLPLDGGAVAPEEVADAVERLAPQCLAVALQVEKFGGRTVAAQPAAGLPLAGGMDHPGDDQRAGDAPFAALDAPVVEDVGEAEIVEGLEAQALAADRARGLVLQGIEVDGGNVGLAVLVGVGLGGLDVHGAGEGLAMCCADTRAGAPGKGDIDATTTSWPHKRLPGAHIRHIEVHAMAEPSI